MNRAKSLLEGVSRHSAFKCSPPRPSRMLATAASPQPAANSTSQRGAQAPDAAPAPNTHYKITLLRSPISLGARIKGTLVSLGIHRRMQTVYHPHAPAFAGKILAVKELVAVRNVPAAAVRTKTEQRRERKASRGFEVVSGMRERGLDGGGVLREA